MMDLSRSTTISPIDTLIIEASQHAEKEIHMIVDCDQLYAGDVARVVRCAVEHILIGLGKGPDE